MQAAAKARYTRNNNDVAAALVLTFSFLPHEDKNMMQRRQLIEDALAGLSWAPAMSSAWALPQVRPALLKLKACFAAFAGDFQAARRTFVDAAKILRSNEEASLWPADPDAIAGPGSSIRAIMIASIELDIGRTMLYTASPDYDTAHEHIETFIAAVPPDTHYFAQAHYELARSLLCSNRQKSRSKSVYEAVFRKAEALVADAERRGVDVPVLKPLTAEGHPMIAQVKGMLAMGQLRRNKASGNSKAADLSSSTQIQCWGCESSDPSARIRTCARCGVAQYCRWRLPHGMRLDLSPRCK